MTLVIHKMDGHGHINTARHERLPPFTLVAHKRKYFCASFATASIFHQSSGNSSICNCGWLKYWSSSCFTCW